MVIDYRQMLFLALGGLAFSFSVLNICLMLCKTWLGIDCVPLEQGTKTPSAWCA